MFMNLIIKNVNLSAHAAFEESLSNSYQSFSKCFWLKSESSWIIKYAWKRSTPLGSPSKLKNLQIIQKLIFLLFSTPVNKFYKVSTLLRLLVLLSGSRSPRTTCESRCAARLAKLWRNLSWKIHFFFDAESWKIFCGAHGGVKINLINKRKLSKMFEEASGLTPISVALLQLRLVRRLLRRLRILLRLHHARSCNRLEKPENKFFIALEGWRMVEGAYFSISGAQWTKSWSQNLYDGFLISSMNVMSRPHGCGRFTMRRSRRTRVICSWKEILINFNF